MVLINAQEVRCWYNDEVQGDFLVYGCKERFDRIDAKRLIDIVHGVGGIVIAAHPYRPFLGCGELMFDLPLDGLEIYNCNNDRNMDYWTKMASEKLGLPIVGGSDAHTRHLVGWSLTEFEDIIKNEEDFVNALRSKRFRAIKRKG